MLVCWSLIVIDSNINHDPFIASNDIIQTKELVSSNGLKHVSIVSSVNESEKDRNFFEFFYHPGDTLQTIDTQKTRIGELSMKFIKFMTIGSKVPTLSRRRSHEQNISVCTFYY